MIAGVWVMTGLFLCLITVPQFGTLTERVTAGVITMALGPILLVIAAGIAVWRMWTAD